MSILDAQASPEDAGGAQTLLVAWPLRLSFLLPAIPNPAHPSTYQLLIVQGARGQRRCDSRFPGLDQGLWERK